MKFESNNTEDSV